MPLLTVSFRAREGLTAKCYSGRAWARRTLRFHRVLSKYVRCLGSLASATVDSTVTQPLAVPVGLVAVVFACLIA
jgi:hypothetical protein